MTKQFDHEQHTRHLEMAERELNALGQLTLANAVGTARLLHSEFQSRIATAKREVVRIQKAQDNLNQIQRTLEEYVTRPEAPWIGCDLFPKE